MYFDQFQAKELRMSSSSHPKEPPIVLVKTWLMLLRSDSEEVRSRASEMLINAFGNMKNAQKFCEENHLIGQ